ncbi:MAG: hypothetical protein JXB47_01550 [Anaerolineae bacterium]|nr:hypothetical protein [Anaerolineae bacterium]
MDRSSREKPDLPPTLPEEIAHKGAAQLAFEVGMACSLYFTLIGGVFEGVILLAAVGLRAVLHGVAADLRPDLLAFAALNLIITWYLTGLVGGAITGLVGGRLGLVAQQDRVFDAGLILLAGALVSTTAGALTVVGGGPVLKIVGTAAVGGFLALPVMIAHLLRLARRQ